MSTVLRGLADARDVLFAARPGLLVAAMAAYLVGTIAIGLRLSVCARVLGIALSLHRATAMGLGAVFTSHVTVGAGAGELARLAWLRRAALGLEAAIAALTLDRLADGFAVAGLIAIALLSGASPQQGPLLALLPLALAGCALLLLLRRGRLPPPPVLARALIVAIPAAIAAWAADLLRLHLVACAVGLEARPATLCALALAALLGGHAPTPGGLGAVEAAMFATGATLGLPTAPLFAFVLADRALTLGLGTALGAACTVALVRPPRRRTA